MNLPLKNPPVGWTVSRRGDAVVVKKEGGDIPVTRDHFIAAGVAGVCPLGFTIGVQMFSTRLSVGEILSQPQTFSLLLFTPVLLGLVYLAKRQFGRKLEYQLSPSMLRLVQVEPGRRTKEEVPRERVRGLLRYVPEDLDGKRMEGASLVLEWRTAAGEDRDLYLGLFEGTVQGEWFTRLFEAWSGRRAVLTEVASDEEDEDEAEDR